MVHVNGTVMGEKQAQNTSQREGSEGEGEEISKSVQREHVLSLTLLYAGIFPWASIFIIPRRWTMKHRPSSFTASPSRCPSHCQSCSSFLAIWLHLFWTFHVDVII